MSLRKAARGKPCLMRIPGCLGGTETTVLCHYSLPGYFGRGLKAPDEMGAFGCSYCHDVVDGRVKAPEGWTRTEIRLAHCEGVLRTHAYQREVAHAY